MLCVDCGFDTATADLASAMAVLGDVDERIAAFVLELRHRTETGLTTADDLARVLALCAALESARHALLGRPGAGAATGRSRVTLDGDVPMYSALALLSTEAGWLQRASVSLVPRSPNARISPALAEAVHDLQHAVGRLQLPTRYSAGETSPLS